MSSYANSSVRGCGDVRLASMSPAMGLVGQSKLINFLKLKVKLSPSPVKE